MTDTHSKKSGSDKTLGDYEKEFNALGYSFTRTQFVVDDDYWETMMELNDGQWIGERGRTLEESVQKLIATLEQFDAKKA